MRQMRVADYLAERVAGLGVRHVFVVTGGGAMHLDDAFGLRRDLQYVCCHHEQACAIAAEGYARVGEGIGVALVTTGPAGTNCLTGVLGQWHDSVPALYLSGQVRYDTTVASTALPLRQLGDQECDIVRLVAPITKYAASVHDAASVRYHFERAVWLAAHGRPGPVWLDVPLNVQAAQVDPAELPGFDPSELDEEAPAGEAQGSPSEGLQPWPPVRPAAQARGASLGIFDEAAAKAAAHETMRRLRAAARPVVLGGGGIRCAGAQELFLRAVEALGVPVCTAWNAHDLLWEEHPLYAGRPGSIGDRAGNFAVQNADVLLSLACRLNVRQVGYEFPAFAHGAYRIVVDIDEAELAKPTIFPSLAVHADVRFFLEELLRQVSEAGPVGPRAEWQEWCRERRRRYPVVSPGERRPDGPVSAYVFVDELARRLEGDDVVVCANGAACVVTFQALTIKRGQRLLANSGTAGMGYDLPAAVGAAFALRARGEPQRRVVCLAGDGSIQMNLQELQTIVHHELPVKVFVFENQGYLSIRQTQDNVFGGRRMGEGPDSGVTFPDMVRLAEAYGIEATRVGRHGELGEAIGAALVRPGPSLVAVAMDPAELFAPRIVAERLPDGSLASKPLEDMFPFLSREELAANMLVPPYDAGER